MLGQAMTATMVRYLFLQGCLYDFSKPFPNTDPLEW